jgi:NTP pyrophosphatase (non-canonical NTP hydrolase)
MSTLNDYAEEAHAANAVWWYDEQGRRLDRNRGELIALMHSELSEALEGVRKSAPDDHLPHRLAEEVELADLLIRVFDYAGAFELDLEGAYREKLAYNATRLDHRREAQGGAHGKKF